MRKIILFFILILGFMGENKAQFAASSEVHYYVYVGSDKEYNRKVDEVVAVKFGNQTMKMIPLSLTTLKFRKSAYLNEITKKLNETNSYYKTYQYRRPQKGDILSFDGDEYCYEREDSDFEYTWNISKDKELMVEIVISGARMRKYVRDNIGYFLNGGFIGGEFYYQKIEKEELVNIEITSSSKEQKSSYNNTETSSILNKTVHNNNYRGETSSNNNYNSGSNQHSTGTWVTKTCTACNGTGKSIAKNYAPNYGGTRTKSYCNICNGYEYPHSHKTCGICKGKGYVKEYKY